MKHIYPSGSFVFAKYALFTLTAMLGGLTLPARGQTDNPGWVIEVTSAETRAGQTGGEAPAEKTKISWKKDGWARALAPIMTDDKAKQEGSSLLLVVPMSVPYEEIQNAAATAFGRPKLSKLYILSSEIAALYSSGRTTGVVVRRDGSNLSMAVIKDGTVLRRSFPTTTAWDDMAREIDRLNDGAAVPIDILLKNVLLTGPGFTPADAASLKTAIQKQNPKVALIKVVAPPALDVASWNGGSILGSMENFNGWLSKAQYEADPQGSLSKLLVVQGFSAPCKSQP